MKRTIPLVITFIVGMIVLAEPFVVSWRYKYVYTLIKDWGIVLIAGAYVMGLVNLLQLNVPIIARRGPDWPYKVFLILGLVVTMVAGFWAGPTRSDRGTFFEFISTFIFDPLNATMFSLLAFFIASAAFRAFRARNLDATLLLLTAMFVMFARIPLGETVSQAVFGGPYLQDLMNWILDVPNTAAKRAILIGAALGAVSTGLRVILGLDRSHLGS